MLPTAQARLRMIEQRHASRRILQLSSRANLYPSRVDKLHAKRNITPEIQQQIRKVTLPNQAIGKPVKRDPELPFRDPWKMKAFSTLNY